MTLRPAWRSEPSFMSQMPFSPTTLFPARTKSAEETRELGMSLGRVLAPGSVVALYGKLGSGKTQFVKGVCAAWEIPDEEVSSPTFTIVHEYRGIVPVFHLDLYRLTRSEEVDALGLEEYLELDGICLIEWPELLESRLPPEVVRLVFLHGDGDLRSIELGGGAS